MKQVFWFVVFAALAGLGYWYWSWSKRRAELKRAAEERFATFMAQAMVSPKATPDPAQRLLFDAASKAGEANEPVLSIQLYARLLARFPDTALATQARAAVEAQKKKVAKT
jgi:hypothetical protein